MNTDRIEAIQKGTAYPESHSVAQALLQVWNECAQETASKMVRLERLATLLGSAWFYGDFKAETGNEREMELLMIELGYRFQSEDAVIAETEPKG